MGKLGCNLHRDNEGVRHENDGKYEKDTSTIFGKVSKVLELEFCGLLELDL